MVGLHRLFSARSLTIVCGIATALLSGEIHGASAAAVERRQDSTSVTSTTEEPTSTTATATAKTTEDATTTTSGSSSTATDDSPVSDDFPVCDDPDVKVFCLPKNGTEMWPGETYYVTWNSDNYPKNSTITVELNYANSSTSAGKSAYSSPRTENRMGYVTIKMEEDWLQERSRNNLTLFLVMDDEKSGDRARPEKGATISLVPKPVEHYPPPPPTETNKRGLMIGLPVGLGVVFLILIGLCIGMKKRRQIGLGNVMGRRNKGYGTGKSLGQRLGGSRKRNDAIRLGELEEDPDRYTDDPSAVQRRDSEHERMTGQSFRPDVGRLKTWK